MEDQGPGGVSPDATSGRRSHDGVMTTAGSDRRGSGVTMFADRRIVITVRGALDPTTGPDLERIAGDNLTAQPDVLVLDLTGVDRVDPAAIDGLLRIQEAVAAESVLLRVVASPAARTAIEAAGAADRLNLDAP